MTTTPHTMGLLPPLPTRPARAERLGRRLAWSWAGAAALHLLIVMGCVAFGAALPGTFGHKHGSGLSLVMPLVELVSADAQGQHASPLLAAPLSQAAASASLAHGGLPLVAPAPPAISGTAAPGQDALPVVAQEVPAMPAEAAVAKAAVAKAVPVLAEQPEPAAPVTKKTKQQALPQALREASRQERAPAPTKVPAQAVPSASDGAEAQRVAAPGTGAPGADGKATRASALSAKDATSGGSASAAEHAEGATPEQTVPFGQPTGPSYKSRIEVEYPAQALRQQLTGKVVLRVRIAASGEVESVQVISSSHAVFVRAAERAVRSATFHPFTEGGKAQPCWTVLPVEFRIAS